MSRLSVFVLMLAAVFVFTTLGEAPLGAQIVGSRPIPIPHEDQQGAGAEGQQAQPDPAQQIAQLRAAVEKGDKDAPFQLGVMYLIGQGVAQDGAQAAALFKKAEMTPARMCFVAEAYMETAFPERVEEAKRWATAANSSCGFAEMAGWYGGVSLGPDEEQEVAMLKRALAAKDDGTQRWVRAELGELILKGSKVEATAAERVSWMGAAARRRVGQAEWMVAGDFAQHAEESASPSEYLEWARKSARYGNANALVLLGQAAMNRQASDLTFLEGMALYDLGMRQVPLSAVGVEMQRRQLEPEQREELGDEEALFERVSAATGGYYTKNDELRFDAPVDEAALAKLAAPANPDAELRLGFAYETQGEAAKAEALYREVWRNGEAAVWVGRAEAVAQEGKWKWARDLYERGAAVGSRKACAEVARIDAEGLAGSKDPVGGYLWLLRAETQDAKLLAQRKSALTREQLKNVELSQAEWLLAHPDYWKGDVTAAQELVAANGPRFAPGSLLGGPLKPVTSPAEWKKKADAGDAGAAYMYATELLAGRGVETPTVAKVEAYAAKGAQTEEQKAHIAWGYESTEMTDEATRRKYAEEWWMKVGGSRGYYQLGVLFNGKSDGTVATDDEKQAVAYWEKSVDAGGERYARIARMKLGYCVVKGWSSGDKKKDAAWAHELAMEMLNKEFYEVAGEYSYGHELAHNPATWYRLSERAAIYNSDNAQSQVAQGLIEGKWKHGDDIDAYAWMKLHSVKQDTGDTKQVEVAEQNPELKRKIEARYAVLVKTRAESGAYYPQDDALRTATEEELERRAKESDPEAQLRLGTLLEQRGTDEDLTRAIGLYHEIWAKANPEVRLAWGRRLMYGTDGVARDDVGAEKWLWDAANAGSHEACKLLALIYGEGRGVKADAAAAEAWRELGGEAAQTEGLTAEQKSAVAARVAEWTQKHPGW